MPEAIELEGKKVKPKKRFTQSDKDALAEATLAELARRKDSPKRKDREQMWDEVDRQIKMCPDLRIKKEKGDLPKHGKEWLPEFELPFQRQALEILSADARRLLFPKERDWFNAYVGLTDEFLRSVDFESIILGDESEVPTQINQENANKLVEGFLRNNHSKYNLRHQFDLMNGEAFKYGSFAGRLRKVKKTVYKDVAKGVERVDQEFVVFFARSIRNTYLDDSEHNMFREGVFSGPSHIEETKIRLADLLVASQKGSKNPDDMQGGWMPDQVRMLEEDKHGEVQLVEIEGDIIIPRKTTSPMVLPNTIATIAHGDNKPRTIRIRFSDAPFSSYITGQYHVENVGDPYGTGPLGMGATVQIMGNESANRFFQWAALNTDPPIQYDPNDPWLAAEGGPQVYPGARWASVGGVEPQQIGEGGTLFTAFQALTSMYADLLGILPARVGSQTISHTTAFAKEAELERGASRTVDYTNTVQDDPMLQFLNREYEMAKRFKGKKQFYIKEYGGFVEINSSQLPDIVEFEVLGAGGPADEAARDRRKQQAFASVVQLEITKQQLPQSELNIEGMQREILGDAGIVEADKFLTAASETATRVTDPGGQLPGIASASPTTL